MKLNGCWRASRLYCRARSVVVVIAAACSTAPVMAQELMSFAAVVDQTLAASPAIEAGKASLLAAGARREQAAVRPNPTLNLTGEDVLGSGPFSELGRSEVTFSYQQKFERGGKRAARQRLATEEQNLLAARQQLAVLALIYQLEQDYRKIQALQARVRAFDQQRQLAESLRDIVQQRRERGRDSDVALDNAEIRLLRLDSLQQEALRALNNAKLQLQARWQNQLGSPPSALDLSLDLDSSGGIVAFALEQGSFQQLDEIDSAELRLQQHPQLLQWGWREARAQAVLGLEQSKTYQDPTVSAGLRYVQESQDVALVVGVSMPLALYNRNRGHVNAALAELDAVRWQQAEDQLRLQRQYQRFRGEAKQAKRLAERLQQGLIERAYEASEKVLQRRRQGAASDLDVYAAQSLVADLEQQLIDTQERFHLAQAGQRFSAATYVQQFPQWFDDRIQSASKAPDLTQDRKADYNHAPQQSQPSSSALSEVQE